MKRRNLSKTLLGLLSISVIPQLVYGKESKELGYEVTKPDKGMLINCHLFPREKSTCITYEKSGGRQEVLIERETTMFYVKHDGTMVANLDGYTIIPTEVLEKNYTKKVNNVSTEA